MDSYKHLYQQSITHPETFWHQQEEQHLTWDTPWHTVLSGDLHEDTIRWFDGGHLNVTELGDVSTLAEPDIVRDLIKTRLHMEIEQ